MALHRFTGLPLLKILSDKRYRHGNKKEEALNSYRRNNRRIGSFYEEKAAEYLERHGMHIVERNYRCRAGEIDLIAKDGAYVVFVEVKYRSTEGSGNPLDAVDIGKQRTISKVAKRYLLSRYHSLDIPCRFDVVGFEGNDICWIKDAFDDR